MNGKNSIRSILLSLSIITAIVISLSIPSTNAKEESKPLAFNKENTKRELVELEESIKSFTTIFGKVASFVGPSVVKIIITRKVNVDFKRGTNKRSLAPPAPIPFNKFFKEKTAQQRTEQDVGSGVIIDPKGYIVTNFHVIRGYKTGGDIEITMFNGQKFIGNVVGVDPKTDLAVLKIDGDDFYYAEFGDASKVKVGDWVVAIGSPFNYQQTVSTGIISALGRKHVTPNSSIFAYEDFFQTDAAVNPGSSGGPLVNLSGEIIGINSAIATQSGSFQGIAFAISATIVKKIAMNLIENGTVSRGHIGVGTLDIDKKLVKELGLQNSDELLDYLGLESKTGSFVARVWKNTPALKGGIRPGDVILEIDGKKIDCSTDMQNITREATVDAEVNVIVVRHGKQIQLSVTIGRQPDYLDGVEFISIQSGALDAGFGLTVVKLKRNAKAQEGYIENGILVVNVDKKSVAEASGIEPGDIIDQVGYVKFSSVYEFYKALNGFIKIKKPVTIHVVSKGFVTLMITD